MATCLEETRFELKYEKVNQIQDYEKKMIQTCIILIEKEKVTKQVVTRVTKMYENIKEGYFLNGNFKLPHELNDLTPLISYMREKV